MKRQKEPKFSKLYEEDGATLVIVALLLFGFVAFTAMAVDVAHLYGVRNELHNAADAGALAGARCLYDCMGGVTPGSILNTNANQIAYNAAIANKSEGQAVEVNWTSGTNTGDVQRGHWSFGTRQFTPAPNNWTAPPTLFGVPTATLDSYDCVTDPTQCVVNAVRVQTRRESTQAKSFFARILGYAGFTVRAEAVAYLGYAGTLNPHDVDQPIAICSQSLGSGLNYTCTVGRVLNSGNQLVTTQTGQWTNFQQPLGCSGGAASDPSVGSVICQSGNPTQLTFGLGLQLTNGTTANNYDAFECCWMGANSNCQPHSTPYPNQPWKITLPVVDCSGNSTTCMPVVGAVTVNVLWITNSGEKNQIDKYAPYQMGGWSSSSSSGTTRWDSFVSYYNLTLPNGNLATDANGGFLDNTIYFEPDCSYEEPQGVSGGQNFGILALIPVLVR